MQQEMKLRRRIAGGAMACVLSCGLMVPQLAFATPDSSSKQAEAQAVLASLNSMQYQLDQASADYGQALEEQAQARQSADQAQERIDQINVEIADVQSRLGDRAQSMYRTGASSFLDLLLGSTSFSEFATNWDLLNKVNDNDAELVQRNKDLRTEAQEQKATFDEQSRTAAAKASEAKQIQDEAQATVNSMQQTYDGLSAEVATLVEEERAAQAAAAAATAQQTVDQSAAQATQRMGIAGATNNNANAGGNGGNGGAVDNGGGNTWTDDSGDAGNTGWTDNGNSGNTDNSGGSSSSSSWAPSYNASTGNAIVDRAYSCIGAPYEWGGVGPDSFDCSGLVSYALTGSYSRYGTTYTFMGMSQVSDPQPGDICTSWSHCGIYIGGGQMIHAPTFGQTVCVSSVQSDMIIVRPW